MRAYSPVDLPGNVTTAARPGERTGLSGPALDDPAQAGYARAPAGVSQRPALCRPCTGGLSGVPGDGTERLRYRRPLPLSGRRAAGDRIGCGLGADVDARPDAKPTASALRASGEPPERRSGSASQPACGDGVERPPAGAVSAPLLCAALRLSGGLDRRGGGSVLPEQGGGRGAADGATSLPLRPGPSPPVA